MAELTLPPLDITAFNRLTPKQKLGAMAAVAVMVALAVAAILWTREPPYSLLFSGLSEKDGGQIVTTLQQQNIPYKFGEGGNSILVPAAQVHDVRLKLASQGLPRGGNVGFEIMEGLKLGATQFAEQIAYQRGLEGELARTIATLGSVRAARVHLAIPKQTAFLRDEKPSASVLVNLLPGRALDPIQIAGIVHLVSSSVPMLTASQVSVVDQDGNLVSQQPEALRNAGLDPSQLKYVKDIEAAYVKRIEAILSPVVGTSNLRSQVSADIDFSHVEQVAEIYKPNPAPGNTVRSQQTAETGNSNPNAVGVPGALTNQPPVPATAPITSPPVPGATVAGAGGPTNFSRNATINYEVDKTVRHTRGVPGVLRRLTIAVVVNQKTETDKKGKTKPLPLSADEVKQIEALVKDAVGFSLERGDSIQVANVSFAPPEKEVIPDLPLWKNPEVVALAREAARYLLLFIVGFAIWRKVFKPIFDMYAASVRRIAEAEAAKAKAEEDARKAEEEAALAAAQAVDAEGHPIPTYESKLKEAHELARNNPQAIANVIKEWMGAGQS